MLPDYDALSANPFAFPAMLYSVMMAGWLDCVDAVEETLQLEPARRFGGEPDVFPPTATAAE